MNAPIIHCRGPQADAAWRVHSALLKALRDAPELADDARFLAMKQEAYARFLTAFERA